jgi:adenosylcobyric acid synthase
MSRKVKPAKCISVLGTGSDVGKSIVTAALCRIFSNLGINVAPYKAQNMSNNSYVTLTGGEMGRAQIVQAQAARVEPHVDMNPVLLKPSTDTGAQVVLYGKPIGTKEAGEYFADTDYLFGQAKKGLNRLRDQYELICMEGAGSCAEVNLRRRDFVNFRMAHEADAPVILVADIDRGGVFAQIIGTLNIIPEPDRKRVKGIIINRFRGDAALFKDGIDYIEQQTGLPVLGLIPFFRHIDIDSEDSLPLDVIVDPPSGPDAGRINIAVLLLPHISNFTDFSPFARDTPVNLHYLARPRNLAGYDAVVLPGTKNVRSDLGRIGESGWDKVLLDFAENGGELIGICGGYQMLGRIIHDPHGIEGPPGNMKGLGLLDVETTMHREKVTTRSTGIWSANKIPVEGYEIHMGLTTRGPGVSAAIRVSSRNGEPQDDEDGAVSNNGKVWGAYFHGLFDLPDFRFSFLKKLRPDLESVLLHDDSEVPDDYRDRQYELLDTHFREHLNMPKLLQIADFPYEG